MMLSLLICLHPAICCDAKLAEAASTPLCVCVCEITQYKTRQIEYE